MARIVETRLGDGLWQSLLGFGLVLAGGNIFAGAQEILSFLDQLSLGLRLGFAGSLELVIVLADHLGRDRDNFHLIAHFGQRALIRARRLSSAGTRSSIARRGFLRSLELSNLNFERRLLLTHGKLQLGVSGVFLASSSCSWPQIPATAAVRSLTLNSS